MLDELKILKEARDLGSTKTLADIQTLVATYNYDTLVQQEKARYRAELWDKISPINGISPEKILEDAPTNGEIYLIYVDDRLIFLQKHDPEQIGFAAMSSERALEVANKTINRMVEEKVDEIAKKDILLQLLS